MSKSLSLTAVFTIVLAGQLSRTHSDRLFADEKDAVAETSRTAPENRPEATVQGRFMHRGRPLAGCRVVLLPLHRFGGAYHYDEESKPFDVTTDNDGVYLFEKVPSGSYKLKWLPHGTRQWIRRIGARPEVVVQGEESVHVKDIAALRTIN